MPASPSASPFASLSDDAALARPLCVDLDGTLVVTDTLWEGFVGLLRERPWLILLAPLWLLSGRAGFKRAVASRISLDPASLPYREELVEALRAAKQRGRKLALATAADREVAEGIAGHLELFDDVFASDGKENLKAHHKRERLTAAYGARGFDYVGDSGADLSVFAEAERGFLVGASAPVAALARRAGNVDVVSRRPSVLRAIVKQMRPHQWSKNALVVLPVLLSPGIPPIELLLRGLGAALAFSLCASAGYVFNDLLDLGADRAHPTKRRRPLASGALPVLFGPPLFVGLLAAGFALSVALFPPAFTVMLAIYFVATVTYSLYFKRLLLLDVIMLAGLYTHRILAGGVATTVPISAWLLGFSMFFFLSLAFVKRFTELLLLEGDGKIRSRAYYRADLQMVASMGGASGYLAALVFSLYVEYGAPTKAYREVALLWLVVPVLLYWVSRVWILAGRGQMQDDPVKFALRDRISLVCGAIVLALALAARFAPPWVHTSLWG
jgi:4-hydroxybenzoate polyprenyltransferase